MINKCKNCTVVRRGKSLLGDPEFRVGRRNKKGQDNRWETRPTPWAMPWGIHPMGQLMGPISHGLIPMDYPIGYTMGYVMEHPYVIAL